MATETSLSLYECQQIIDDIDALALQNDGEIPEEALQALVEAQTKSIAKLGSLCGFAAYARGFVDLCKQEEDRIKRMRQVMKNRLDSVQKYVAPYMASKDYKKQTVGVHTITVRKTTSVEISEPFVLKEYCRVIPESLAPDKAKIKEALKAGKEVQGAVLKHGRSVTLK